MVLPLSESADRTSRRRRAFDCGIETLFTAKFSSAGFGPWAFVTGPLRFAHPGKMGLRNG